MFFSGGQCGHVGRPEELLLMFKIFLVICLHVVLVISLEGTVPVLFHIFSCFLCVYVCVCLDFFFTVVK